MEQLTTEDVIDIFRQIPDILENSRQALTNSRNEVEIWELRVQEAIRFINVLNQRFLEMNIDLQVVTKLGQLQLSFQNVYSDIEAYLSRPAYCQSHGRPRLSLQKEDVLREFEIFRSWKLVAKVFGVSVKTLYRRRIEFGIPVSPRIGQRVTYTTITHQELCHIVEEVPSVNPDSGETMMIGALRSRQIYVQRWRIRYAINAVDPLSRLLRRRISVVRRTYNVSSPNALWHIDGHHKLIRWKFVIHGGIDGYSRMIVYLECSTNNLSVTVLKLFQSAVEIFGLPERVRCDLGVENRDVSRFMLHNRGINRRSMLVGSSVHNQRIERLWRDVKQLIVRRFQVIFYYMEDCGILDPLNEIHLTVLHIVFLPVVNLSLKEFISNWNNHPMSSERNFSPSQLHRLGMMEYERVNTEGFNHLINYQWDRFGVEEYDFPDVNDDDDDNVFVPDLSALSTDNIVELERILVNLSDQYDDIEKYEILLDIALHME